MSYKIKSTVIFMFCKIHRNECVFFVHNLQKHKVYQSLSYVNKEKYI